MTRTISEDDRYRTSTQYRLCSYTPSSLRALRSTTNRIAVDRVREANRRVADKADNGRSANKNLEEEVDCLTVEEELKLLVSYCRQTIQLGDHLKLPTDVTVRIRVLK